MVRIFNPGATPVQTTLEGRELGGGEWDQVDADDMTTAHLAAGRLVEVAVLPSEAPVTEAAGQAPDKPSKGNR